jgi:DNA-binding IclR family transcriptional regulator
MNREQTTEPVWSNPSLREPSYSQSLEGGLALLGCFTPQRPVLGIADIAEDLGMSRSTTHRYVITLVALGYLEQGASRKYHLGLRVTDLGMSALNSTGLREHSHPYLEELRQRTSYTVNLSVLDGSDILYVDRARSFRRGQSKIGPPVRGRYGSLRVSVELTAGQVDQVVRDAGEGGRLSVVLSAVGSSGWPFALRAEGGGGYSECLEDARLSRSLLFGLLVFSCFPTDGGYVGVVEVARMLGMNTSTAHRYVSTLVVVGLLERDPESRKYRVVGRA